MTPNTPPDTSLQTILEAEDQNAVARKRDHIELAFQSQVGHQDLDTRFYYDPLLAAHPSADTLPQLTFLGKSLNVPMWVSSMTGGTALANTINHNLARACGEFGMGMGLGSCRSLLYSDEYLKDFDVRDHMPDQPLYANLGIAQLEQLLDRNHAHIIQQLVDKLRADGLIVHVNPLQEWLQPEGDRFQYAPVETIKRLIDALPDLNIIVKEVGQGFGRESLKALFQLPLAAIDFAANGGTNFAKLELLRSQPIQREIYSQLAQVGHSAEDMVNIANEVLAELSEERIRCREVIISGGVRTFLDGYYLTQKLQANCVYGQASSFLKHARDDYDSLASYVSAQVQGLALCHAYLTVRK